MKAAMRALVVYESMFGNTRQVAQAIGAGLATSCAVDVVQVAELSDASLDGVELLVAGGPTHVHGMARPTSRVGAREQAEQSDGALTLEPNATEPGLREWLDTLADAPRYAAAFDTRMQMSPILSGRAAPKIARELKHRGCQIVVEPESFLVAGKVAALVEGEVERARAWGEALAKRTAAAASQAMTAR